MKSASSEIRKKRKEIAVVAVIVFSGLIAGVVVAVSASPNVFVNQATVYRNILESDDWLVLVRYQLPQQDAGFGTPVTTAEAWCAQLVNQSGCIDDPATTDVVEPVDPDEPNGIQPSAAHISFYSDAAFTVLEQQVLVPRIHYSLGGLYLSPGHGQTWGGPNYYACVESSSALFSPAAQDCFPVIFNTAESDNESQIEKLSSDLISEFLSLEASRNIPPNSFVISNKITGAGKVIALEAFNLMDQVAPDAFQASSGSVIGGDFVVADGTPVLQGVVNATATAEAGEFIDKLDGLGGLVLGVSGQVATTLLFLLGGIAFGAYLHHETGSIVLVVITVLSASMIGMLVGGPSVGSVGLVISIAVIIAAGFALKKWVS